MQGIRGGTTRVMREPYEKTISTVRRMLTAAGLSIVDEFDMSKEPYFHFGVAGGSCTVLLLDTPILMFEAIVLDHSTAVFLPLHVVVSGDRETSCVHWADPLTSSGLRPPASGKSALEQAYKRLTDALSGLPQPAGLTAPTPSI